MSLLSVPYVLLYESFKNWCWTKFYEILYWGPCAKDYLSCQTIPLRSFKDYVVIFLKDKLLFHLRFFKKCDIPFYDEKLWFYLRNFYVGKTGCYNNLFEAAFDLVKV